MSAIVALTLIIGNYLPASYSFAATNTVQELQASEELYSNDSELKQNTKEPNENMPGFKAKDNEQVKNITATAYAPGPHDNGKWGNLTHLGTKVRPGVIAVDPKVIPLGTKLYIEFSDGHGMYGVAEDTGGAIKGNRIDIAMWTVAEANDFGMQEVKVHVLN